MPREPSSRRQTGRAQQSANTGAILPQFPPDISAPHISSVGLSYLPTADGSVAEPPLEFLAQRSGGFHPSSQDRLRAFADASIYPQPRLMGSPSTHHPSHPPSNSSYSQISFFTGTTQPEEPPTSAPAAPQPRTYEKVPPISAYEPKTQEVIRYAQVLSANDVITEVGWLYGPSSVSAVRTNTKENFCLACEKANISVVLDRPIEYLIVKWPSTMRSKLVKFAENYAKEFLVCPDPEIKNDPEALNEWKKNRVTVIINQKAPQTFFLHERGSDGNVTRLFGNSVFERFHLDFWYTQAASPVAHFKDTYKTTPTSMLALSATALLCALQREGAGQKSDASVLKFRGTDYGLWYDCYRKSMTELLDHNAFGKQFSENLLSLHKNGLEMLETTAGAPGSGQIPAPVVIPESLQAMVASSSTQPVPSTSYLDHTFSGAQAGPSTFLSDGQKDIASSSTQPVPSTSYLDHTFFGAQAGPSTFLSDVQKDMYLNYDFTDDFGL